MVFHVSLNADSWNNRNAISTSKYWLKKLFLTLEEWQNDIVLSNTVWLDETYYSVIMSDREHKEDGTLPRGLSRNQICIGVATDKKHTICVMEGYGKPSQKRSYQAFQNHIQPNSILIHDKENLFGCPMVFFCVICSCFSWTSPPAEVTSLYYRLGAVCKSGFIILYSH